RPPTLGPSSVQLAGSPPASFHCLATHMPRLQTRPAPHSTPQAPQFFGSRATLAHPFPHQKLPIDWRQALPFARLGGAECAGAQAVSASSAIRRIMSTFPFSARRASSSFAFALAIGRKRALRELARRLDAHMRGARITFGGAGGEAVGRAAGNLEVGAV